MNDRYLFRGKQIDNGGWIEGFYRQYPIYFECGACIKKINHFIDKLDGNSEFVDPATVGQCTGLRDKNGKLIFEGDIVSSTTDDDEPEIYRVEFENYSWELRSPIYDSLELRDFVNDYTALEIIGNIYDNPELLGRSADDE